MRNSIRIASVLLFTVVFAFHGAEATPKFRNNGTDKVTICHIPPGNPENAHILSVGSPAVSAHVQNHGDSICSSVKCCKCPPRNLCEACKNSCGCGDRKCISRCEEKDECGGGKSSSKSCTSH